MDSNLVYKLERTKAPYMFRVAHQLMRLLPPLVAPVIGTRLYPFEAACDWDGEVCIRSITGRESRWPVSDIHGYHFALHRYHDWRLLAVAQTVVRRGDMMIEVGANIGTETVPFADIVGPMGHVLAFEPVPRNVAVLRAVLESAGASNVTVESIALGDRDGELPFVAPTDTRFTGIGYLARNADESAAQVQVRRLDDILPPGTSPVMIAIDVEGAELAVLEGAREVIARARPVIALEACGRHAVRAGTSLEKLNSTIVGMGYAAMAIRRYGLKPVEIDDASDPCNWVAVPVERRELFDKISSRILRSGSLPPWRGLNPLAEIA